MGKTGQYLQSRTSQGQEGIRVSLQYRGELGDARSRLARRQFLNDRFAEIAIDLASNGVDVDLDSLSVSGQTVEAILPSEKYDRLLVSLVDRGLRVDPLVERQIIPS